MLAMIIQLGIILLCLCGGAFIINSMAHDLEINNRHRAPIDLREATDIEREYFINNYWELGIKADNEYTEHLKELSENLKVSDGKIILIDDDINYGVMLVDVVCKGEIYRCCHISIPDDELNYLKKDDEVVIYCSFNKKKEMYEIITTARKDSIINYEKFR